MVTFFSKYKSLRLNLGEKVTDYGGDRKTRVAITATFQDNVYKPKTEEEVKILRALPDYNNTFFEADETADLASLRKAGRIPENGKPVTIGVGTTTTAPAGKSF